ncbi:MAG: DNA translocase FtsK [Eubacterium sp.]|nr:DNA translocase FtsK [Eubacterium sp.]
MPAKKTTVSRKTSTAKKNELDEAREALIEAGRSRRRLHSIVLFAVGVLLVFFVLIGFFGGATVKPDPNLLDYIYMFLCGIFGFSVFFTGPIAIYVALLIAMDKSGGGILKRVVQLAFSVMLICSFVQILFVGSVGAGSDNVFGAIGVLYSDGINLTGGGVYGGLLAWILLLFGNIGALVLIILIAFVFIMFISRKTLLDFLHAVGKPVKKTAATVKDKHRQHKEEMEALRKASEENYAEIHKENYQDIPEDSNEDMQRQENIRKINELEKATRENLHQPIPSRHRRAMDQQKRENQEFINEINSYNGRVTEQSPKAVKQSEDILPEIAQEKDVHISDGILPDLPDNIKDVADEADIPNDIPLPDEPPEEVNPVEQALNEYAASERLAADEQAGKENEFIETVGENGQDFDDTVSDNEQYILPPTTLLDEIVPGKAKEDIQKELDLNSENIVKTLSSFGVQTKIVGVCRGPSVTRYELQPAAGVKISRITGLADDIALNLAADGIRIEAPIPGKPAVGIEVPNKQKDSVLFREMIESNSIRNNDSKLATVLGKDISGETIILDIANMPHLLVAGTTGSGKSVCVNSMIVSILFRSTPEEVRFIMIDPKQVEFMTYNGIPHLLIPVVTDPKKAAGALAWAVTEMLKRYNLFAEYSVRDLKGYNALADRDPDMKKLPQIVIFIDELADLMMASKNEVEDSICRLAQMARAAGMHLVIATQRPSADVVTGLIKTNIPSRIGLKVGSGVDSRIILDEQGAEKLLGNGDLLFKSTSMPKPKRVQGCWISPKEIDRVVTFIKNSFILDYDDEVMREVEEHAAHVNTGDKKGAPADEGGDIDVSDEKLEDAIRTVVEAGQASTSALQRKLKLGYGRAARLIDIMEEMGIVGPSEGSKPRQVLMTREEYYERQMNRAE